MRAIFRRLLFLNKKDDGPSMMRRRTSEDSMKGLQGNLCENGLIKKVASFRSKPLSVNVLSHRPLGRMIKSFSAGSI